MIQKLSRLYRGCTFYVRLSSKGWYASCITPTGIDFGHGPTARRCDALYQCGLFVDALLDTPIVPTIHLETNS